MLSLTRVLNGNVIAVHCLLARSFCHHVEERNRSSNQECKFKTKSNYNPQYYQKNKDKRAEYMKGYNESHKDTLQAQRSNYRSHRKAKLLQDLASLPELRESIERSFSVSKPSDWYNFTLAQLRSFPATRRIFKTCTIVEFVKAAYPEEKWVVGRFKAVPKRFWAAQKNTRDFLEHLATKLGIQDPTDWYRISHIQMRTEGGGGCLSTFGTLSRALSFAFPEEPWDFHKLSFRGKKSIQRILLGAMPKVMGASKMLENYHHPDLTWEGMRKRKGRWKDEGEGNRGKGREGKGKEEGKGQGKGSASKMLQNYHHRDLTWEGQRTMELDFWIPELRVGVEYHGQQHYHHLTAFWNHGGFARDQEKLRRCREAGIRLLTIPYWWDTSVSSLEEIMKEGMS